MMKGVIISNVENDDKNPSGGSFLWNSIFSAVKAGLAGFSAFFTILLAAKYTGTLLGSIESFSINGGDVLLSLIGFTLMFLIKILERITRSRAA